MIKDVIMLDSGDLPNELPAFERWYLRYHAPEVMSRRGPFLVRFVGYRPLPPISEALPYGYYNLRVTEAWFRSVQERPLQTPLLSFRWQAPWAKSNVLPGRSGSSPVECTVPTQPTEIFLGDKFNADDKTILRWFIVMKYPDGVPVEEGEEWFLNVHSKEVLQQPGLIAYSSHRTIAMPGRPNRWHRVSEQWYEDFYGWRKSVIDSPPKYTRPSWAKYDTYPFLEPSVDFASTFLMERPSIDYLKEATAYP
jgi:hypothetical protein